MRQTKGYTKSIPMLVYSLALGVLARMAEIHYPRRLRIPGNKLN